jgi:hypothetical protein
LVFRDLTPACFTTTAGTTNKMNDVWFDVDLREAA